MDRQASKCKTGCCCSQPIRQERASFQSQIPPGAVAGDRPSHALTFGGTPGLGSLLDEVGKDISARFRKRAEECRELAAQAGTEEWREFLFTLAKDLDEEAAKIDAEDD